MGPSRPRASEAERAYWKKLGDASRSAEAEAPPPASLEEVFERMNAIRERFLRKKPRGA